MPVDKFGRMSDTKTKDTGVSLTYINNNYIRSDGNSRITGNLDMGGSTIENLGETKEAKDAATKECVDRGLREIKHLITINARFCGDIILDDFPFNFGGGDKLCDEKVVVAFKELRGVINGFLMPNSGCIKKNYFRISYF